MRKKADRWQILGSLGFSFSLRLSGHMSDFVNFFVIAKTLRLFLRLKFCGIILKNKNFFNFLFYFGRSDLNQIFFGYPLKI